MRQIELVRRSAREFVSQFIELCNCGLVGHVGFGWIINARFCRYGHVFFRIIRAKRSRMATWQEQPANAVTKNGIIGHPSWACSATENARSEERRVGKECR